ncbi:alanine racemase [Microbacterium gorillae]|uniref:alanine racemase n=1 Tax=Microbacterium gorillae TaxID=1231063 RepID=UPI00058E4378|nr:alanine racemase [Microbacterium gorillae]
MTAEFIVDLAAFAANVRAVRERVAPAEPMLVVKDDAYRHGLAAIVQRAIVEGVSWIGALDVVTGMAVRELAGAQPRVFTWMLAGPDDVADALSADLDLGVGSSALLEDVATVAAQRGTIARVHLKIDTGLHRNGVRPEDWPAVVARAVELEQDGLLRIVGIWSHISEASDSDDDDARVAFDAAVTAARAAGLAPDLLHLAASAAAFARPEFRYDMVRIGAFHYGIRSTDGPSDAELGLTPVGALHAPVRRVGPVDVIVDAGFTDGLLSTAAGNLHAATAAGRQPVTAIGADTLRLPLAEGIEPGQTVTLFGADGADSATDLAERIGTIGEEVVLRLAPDVPRRYIG